jgi:hypothetical protein
MTVGLYLTLLLTPTAHVTLAQQLDPVLLQAILGIYVALLLVVAVAMLFSVATSSALAAVFTLAVVIAGRFADVIQNMREVLPATPGWVAQGIYLTLPNFHSLDLKARVVHGDPVSALTLAIIVAYGCVYCVLLLCASALIFRRKELA